MQGRTEEAQRILLVLGTKRWRAPKASIKRRLNSVHAIDELETLTERVIDAESWDDLFRTN